MARIGRIAEAWGSRTPYGRGESWPTRVDSSLADGLTPDDGDRWVQSATILHSNGDGLDIAVTGTTWPPTCATSIARPPGVSLDWELLAQAAQGARKGDLLELAEWCHSQTLRQVRWANGKLEEAATQALVS